MYDPAFLSVFTYPMLAGDPQTALTRPGSIVLTEDVARRFFGDNWNKGNGVLGRLIQSGGTTYQLTGVLRNIPSNTDMPFQALLSQEAGKLEKQAWCVSYVLFKSATQGLHFGPKLARVTEQIQPDFAKRGGHIAFAVRVIKCVAKASKYTIETGSAFRRLMIVVAERIAIS